MSMSSFSVFALTRSEMKNVVGGDYYCSCSVTNSSGNTMNIEYTAQGSCASSSSGVAYYSYQKNGVTYSGYIPITSVSSSCGQKKQQPPKYNQT